jgi:hypothetical protein
MADGNSQHNWRELCPVCPPVPPGTSRAQLQAQLLISDNGAPRHGLTIVAEPIAGNDSLKNSELLVGGRQTMLVLEGCASWPEV